MPPKAQFTPEERRARKYAYTRRWKAANAARVKAVKAAWDAANAEHVRAYNRATTRAHPEKNRHRVATWNAAHPGASNRRAVQWRRANPEQMAILRARWHAAHPEAHVVSTQKRRAAKMAAPQNDLTRAQWLMIQEAQDHRCYYCGRRCKGKLTQDHIIPLSKGGAHTLHNVIAACRSCNSKKHTGPPPIPVQPFLL